MKNFFITAGKEKDRAKKAFTLVELLITIVVSALVLNGVIMSLVNSMVLNEYNQGFTFAMNIARSQTESVLSRRSNFSTIVSVPAAGDPNKTKREVLTAATNGINGLYRIDVTDIIPNELKNVKISVCWRARGGRVVGPCRLVNNSLTWDPNIQTIIADSSNKQNPCTIETAVAAQ